jgi:hypothetical protein
VEGQDETEGENNDPVQAQHDDTGDRNVDAGGSQDG